MTYRLPPDWQNPRDKDYAQGDTLLEALRNGRVFRVDPATYQPGFLVEEGCDDYFGHVLTPEQLYQLGAELQELALPYMSGKGLPPGLEQEERGGTGNRTLFGTLQAILHI